MIADDHEILREGVVSVLSAAAGVEVVGQADTGEMALALFERLRPDVTILDLKMPGMGGLRALKDMLCINRKARILALTTYHGDVLAREVMEAGAAGYLIKRAMRKELLEAVTNLANGHKYISLDVAMELGQHIDSEPLSARELEVLRLVSVGKTNREIAAQMGVSEETIKSHVKTILCKTRARDRTHAVAIALRRGMLMV